MIDYDALDLPEIRMGKARQRPSPYNTATPFAGALYVEKVTDEVPVLWDCRITCKTREQAKAFQDFLDSVNFSDVFLKNVLTEYGFIQHEVRIINGIPRPTQLSRGVWEYAFRLYAIELILPDFAVCFPGLTAQYLHEASVIDLACNSLWPE